MEDKSIKYPIYSIVVEYIQNGEHSKYEDAEGLPAGRVRRNMHFNKMFKKDQTQEQLDAFTKDWWNRYASSDANNDLDIELIKITTKYKEHESWSLTWFAHETFDIGQSDEEVLQSFEKFVSRKTTLNDISQFKEGKDVYCLMGAEDRWRWSARGGEGVNQDIPPCRCVHCKSNGMIRIVH